MSEARYGFTDQELQAVVPQLEAMKSLAADVLWRLHVKRTPELPAEKQRVLLWWGEEWIEAEYSGVYWYIWNAAPDDHDVRVQDGQYWIPLPTFDPREVKV